MIDGFIVIILVMLGCIGLGVLFGWIDHADILKSGCIRFEDSYKKENVLETISLEDRNFMLGDMCFDREKTKRKLVETIKIRLEL